MTDLFCIHPSVKDLDSFLNLTCMTGHIDKSCLRWNPINPSILIATEWVFYRKDLFTQFKKLYRTADIKIAWMGEAVSADMNIFDYFIGFDNNRESDERFVRLPSPLDMFHRFISVKENDITDLSAAAECLNRKTSFCNFLYSNPKAHPMRDDIFHALAKYKKVDSLGKHLNNVSVPGTGYGNHAHECISIKSPYKFSIAAENACYDGYTSEKIFTSLIAHTIPIYWGNPSVYKDVNPDCFINIDDYDDLDSAIERIIEIDRDDALWQQYISTLWFNSEQTERHKLRSEKYYYRMCRLLSGNATRTTPEGYHIELYRKQFFKYGFAFGENFFDRTLNLIIHH